ncbi:ABC transporter ATP-binding protein [candidate division WOR-3 bacterium]|nr:ABC transporter ATP-binding protein [candidate division WOR-3 bacterium]
MAIPIITIKDLVVEYKVREGAIRVVDDVSLEVPKGRFTALIGESGCGKTTIVEAILNTLPPNGYIRKGEILFNGKNLLSLKEEEQRRFRWKKIATVFQAAQNSLNPIKVIGEQMVETILDHESVSKKEALKKSSNLLELVGLEPSRVVNSYPHEISGGMKQKVIIAMSLLLDPEMLILDEPTTALDLITQFYLLETLGKLHKKLGITMMMVTHDVSNVARHADRVAIMYAGKIVEVGDIDEIFYNSHHPYTIGLLNSIPSIIGDLSKKKPIPGLPPSLLDPPSGCRFHPRCAYAEEVCKNIVPKLKSIGNEHLTACLRWSDITTE